MFSNSHKDFIPIVEVVKQYIYHHKVVNIIRYWKSTNVLALNH